MEREVQALFGNTVDLAQHPRASVVAEAGELPQGALRELGQAVQLARHELDYVVGEALGPNGVDVPLPRRIARVEAEQALVDQRADELDGEEWIAVGLLVHELGQRSRTGEIDV